MSVPPWRQDWYNGPGLNPRLMEALGIKSEPVKAEPAARPCPVVVIDANLERKIDFGE